MNRNQQSQSSVGCRAQLCNLSCIQRLSVSYTMELSSCRSCTSITAHSIDEDTALHILLKFPPFSACPLLKQMNNAEEGQRIFWYNTDRPAHAHERSTKVQQFVYRGYLLLKEKESGVGRKRWQRTTVHLIHVTFLRNKLYS